MHLFSTLPGELINMFKDFGLAAEAVGANAYVIGAYPRSIILKEDCSDIELTVTGDHEKMLHCLVKSYPIAKNKKIKKDGKYLLLESPYNEGDHIKVGRSRKDENGGIGDIHSEIFSRGLSLDSLAISTNATSFGEVIDAGGAMDDIRSGIIRILKRDVFEVSPIFIFRSLYYKARYRFPFEPITETLWLEAVKLGCHKKLSHEEIDAEIEKIRGEKYGKDEMRFLRAHTKLFGDDLGFKLKLPHK